MRKKGILIKNVMALVIAVIGLLILSVVVVRLYQINVNQEQENARKTIDNIMGKIVLLEDGEIGRFAIQGFKGSKNWYLVGWDKRFEDRPDKCFLDNCICICKGNTPTACQSTGFCRNVKNEEVFVYSELVVSGVPPAGEIRYPACISFFPSLQEIQVYKNISHLTIFSETGGRGSCKVIEKRGYFPHYRFQLPLYLLNYFHLL
ncbi:MAG: hypothetical protein IIA87_00450 [Nanoarchaeota archaeon]|nr:hypothetical protein [Nanoarchaeota archaeon]